MPEFSVSKIRPQHRESTSRPAQPEPDISSNSKIQMQSARSQERLPKKAQTPPHHHHKRPILALHHTNRLVHALQNDRAQDKKVRPRRREKPGQEHRRHRPRQLDLLPHPDPPLRPVQVGQGPILRGLHHHLLLGVPDRLFVPLERLQAQPRPQKLLQMLQNEIEGPKPDELVLS